MKCTSKFNIKCSHTTAYDISVCQRIIIRSYTQIYVRGTLGIRRVRSSYAGIRRFTLLYAEDKKVFWTCSKIFSVCQRIDNTLLIRSSYARHTLNTLNTLVIRSRYVTHTLVQTVASLAQNIRYKESFFLHFRQL